jgi:hypothetical protein
LISSRSVDFIASSFLLIGRQCKQTGVWRRRMKECVQVYEQIGGKLERAGDMIDGLLWIIAHKQRVDRQWPRAIATRFLQACHTCQSEMGSVDNEHLGFLLHQFDDVLARSKHHPRFSRTV